MIFFISDTHFGHANVINFDNRPFASVEIMNAELIRRWNAKVQPDDTVYILGDLMWKMQVNDAVSIIKALNGKKHLIKGNHDWLFLRFTQIYELFEEISDVGDVNVALANGETKQVILSHYFMPFYFRVRYGSVLLHGHTHNGEEHLVEEEMKQNLRKAGYRCNAYNVGCMLWNYEPVTLDEIIEREGYFFSTPSD